MKKIPSRREQLIAGALTGDLSDAERLEFEHARAADPTIDAELAELRDMTARLDAADVTWREERAHPSLPERIRGGMRRADRCHTQENGHSTSYTPS